MTNSTDLPQIITQLSKDKALAETAALLVLQKKVHEIWGNDEDSLL